jgi:dTDP-4-dehydrorhamnose 3,5-epimerase-like enzyme
MASILTIPQFKDNKGSVVVMDKIQELLPFTVKRVFFITAKLDTPRGNHRHIRTVQAAMCIHGQCTISVNDGKEKQVVILDDSSKCLILTTTDWHTMHSFSENAVLCVFASENFDAGDYIREPYKNQ